MKTSDRSAHWAILHTREVPTLEGVFYDVTLEREDGQEAYAVVAVCNRASRTAGHEPFDPAVIVSACDHADARDWLEAPEHEYAIGEACLFPALLSRRTA